MAATLNDEWSYFLVSQSHMYDNNMHSMLSASHDTPNTMEIEKPTEKICPDKLEERVSCPPFEELVISTKTKCLYLNTPVSIYDVFWNVPVLHYWEPKEGIIKKQTKIICESDAAYQQYKAKLALLKPYEYNEKVIKFVDNTGYVPLDDGTIHTETAIIPLSKTAANRRKLKYKNERKLTVGMSKKDILNVRRKEKQGAFYNCVAFTLRIESEGQFYECHAKIFNTGKIEVPGKISYTVMELIKKKILSVLQPFVPNVVLDYALCKRGVLINSGFKCGFYIDRDKIYNLLRTKYGIETSYDSCSYQGVKCKYYFNNDLPYDHVIQTGRLETVDAMKKKELNNGIHKYTEVAFMLFRTGSCIIVGNCSKKVLYFIYDFIKTVLRTEYETISNGIEVKECKKKKKARKMNVTMSNDYYRDCISESKQSDSKQSESKQSESKQSKKK